MASKLDLIHRILKNFETINEDVYNLNTEIDANTNIFIKNLKKSCPQNELVGFNKSMRDFSWWAKVILNRVNCEETKLEREEL